MAKKSTASIRPPARRWVTLFYALPLLSVVGIYSYLFYARSHHLRSPEIVVSSSPFFTIPIGGVTANFFTTGDHLQAAGNDLFIEFRDAQNQLTNVGTVTFEMSLNMPGYVMHSIGKVYPSAPSGRYRTAVEPQMGGNWSTRLTFTNEHAGAETNFPIAVK